MQQVDDDLFHAQRLGLSNQGTGPSNKTWRLGRASRDLVRVGTAAQLVRKVPPSLGDGGEALDQRGGRLRLVPDRMERPGRRALRAEFRHVLLRAEATDRPGPPDHRCRVRRALGDNIAGLHKTQDMGTGAVCVRPEAGVEKKIRSNSLLVGITYQTLTHFQRKFCGIDSCSFTLNLRWRLFFWFLVLFLVSVLLHYSSPVSPTPSFSRI
ncbi:hypothetical protein BC936DRAFT_146064 [Jimgerdemannia flammicorona]|uniref:Uncharacterized protein n=1 Tax=Jimgerdemannia flammicorona TaxID=994334 RepID=A0A433D8H3_9FUNG|nr:hypothetical protein BC936DRAFT_146064 [Jimgerdemannia flammicorona]